MRFLALPGERQPAYTASKYVVISGSPSLAEVLRSTLKRLEQNEDLASDDPALNELKGTILRAITELEVGKTPRPAAQQRILWITPRSRPVETAGPRVPETAAPEIETEEGENELEKAAEKPLAAVGVEDEIAEQEPHARVAVGPHSS